MPRKRRRTKKRLIAGMLSGVQQEHFVYGHNLLTERYPVFKNNEHRKELWSENRDSLMALRDGCLSNGLPAFRSGTRPEGWWNYDAKEPRRLISGKFETQFEYLTRLNLLFPGEKEAYHANKKAEKMKKEADKLRLIVNNGEFS